MVDLEGNSRPIEELQEGDWVLARSEFDPQGPLELKQVEAKLVRTTLRMALLFSCSILSCSRAAQHPFYVPAQERFVPAGELQVGDLLVSCQGTLIPIESISQLNEITTVYNLRVADHHTYFVGGALWGWDVWVHNAYKFGSFDESRNFWNGIQRWAKNQNLDKAQTKFIWDLVRQAKKHADGNAKFYAEVSGIMKAVEEFGSNGRGFSLVARSYGYGANKRYGVDLVFRQRTGNQVIDHVVEAKGYSMNGWRGQRDIAKKVGGEVDTINKLLKAEDRGSTIASGLLKRHSAGNVRFHTSYLDGSKTW